MKIIVTGGAGFIGSHFVDLAISRGDEVIVIDDLSFGKKININSNASFIEESLLNYSIIENIVLKVNPTHIVHFAANATTKSSAMGWNDPFLDSRVNMLATLNILEIIRRNSLSAHFLYASSAAVYGEPKYVPMNEPHPLNPQSPYGISKLAGEKYCYSYFKEYNVNCTVLRIFNTYGPRQPRYVMYDQIKKMLLAKHESFEVLGTGEQIRDYVYVSDTVKAFHLAMMKGRSTFGEIYNIGGNSKITIKELINKIKSLVNKDLQPVFTGQSWKGDISKLWSDTTHIKASLGWEPEISIDEGIRNLLNWIKTDNEFLTN